MLFIGRDLVKAFEQINASIDVLIQELQNFKIYARVVLNKTPTPAINSSIEIKLKKRLKQHNQKEDIQLTRYQTKMMAEEI
jgi:hypothetical protein